MRDAVEKKTTRISRRTMIGGAAAGAAAVATSAIGRVPMAQAADGDIVTVGGAFTGTGTTTLHTTGTGLTPAIRGVADSTQGGRGVEGDASSNDGYGVRGFASGDQGTGVVGESAANASNGIGVLGWTHHTTGETRGVYGVSESPRGTGVHGSAAGGLGGTGVRGTGSDGVVGLGVSRGVRGTSDNGVGVEGRATQSDGTGTGVMGVADSASAVGMSGLNVGGGIALQVTGRARFDRSGKVTITFPNKSATVSVPGAISTSSTFPERPSLGLAMLQTDLAGVYVRATTFDTTAGTLTIRLNKAPGGGTNPKSVDVGWFVVN